MRVFPSLKEMYCRDSRPRQPVLVHCYRNGLPIFKDTSALHDQPWNDLSNKVLSLRPTPRSLGRMLLKSLIKLGLEPVSAALSWGYILTSASCSPPSRFRPRHVTISFIGTFRRISQAGLSWLQHRSSISSYHRRRHRHGRQCFRGFIG